ncbi:MAG TPA: OmpA family protein [Clostridia bacterium]|nr:OmpA family protein [Clostridia bacterium]
MSLRRYIHIGRVALVLFALAFALTFSATAAMAQDNPPKAEIFAGYSWLNPGGSVPTGKVPSIPKGFGVASTFNINKYFGLALDFNGHYKDEANVSTFMAGPQLKLRSEQFSPFAEVLFGFSHISPAGLRENNAFALGAGGGFDLEIGRHWSFRLIQADYIYTTYRDKGLQVTANRWDGARLQSGLVFKLGGGAPPVPVSATCNQQPAEVMAGEPVQVTLAPANFNPKRTLSYAWTTTGGKVSGTAASTTVDTTGVAPGSYTVTGRVTDNGKGKNQMTAECKSTYTVKEPPKHPPTIACSASPATIKSGDPATVSCQGNSPDNRPLSYSWNATGGRLSENGPTATLDTAGAPAGPITINATVSDDRNLTASASSTVNVEVPPPPPTSSKINQITFPDAKRPARVDNAAKAVLDDVALRLQREADAKGVVVGYATADETKKKANKNLAAQRAINTKEYLVKEKGIDPTRIEVRTGTGDENKSEIWLVPTGASFVGEGTTVVDESAMAKPVRKSKAAPKAQTPQ